MYIHSVLSVLYILSSCCHALSTFVMICHEPARADKLWRFAGPIFYSFILSVRPLRRLNMMSIYAVIKVQLQDKGQI